MLHLNVRKVEFLSSKFLHWSWADSEEWVFFSKVFVTCDCHRDRCLFCSDTGAKIPESCIFSQLFNMASFLGESSFPSTNVSASKSPSWWASARIVPTKLGQRCHLWHHGKEQEIGWSLTQCWRKRKCQLGFTCAVKPREKMIFVANVGAGCSRSYGFFFVFVSAFCTMYLRYKLVREITADCDTRITRLSKVCLTLAVFSCLGLTFVANFQVSQINPPSMKEGGAQVCPPPT